MSTNALVTGINGQDGAYLTKNLLDRGFSVTGSVRSVGHVDLWRFRELGILEHPNLMISPLQLEDAGQCMALIKEAEPCHIFHLAGHTKVAASFADPIGFARVNAMGTLHLLEAMRHHTPEARFVFASSAELFGDSDQYPQNEQTPFHPRNPYAITKQFAHAAAVCYRESYNLHTSCAILFNHESPLRGPEFVTRKISLGVAHIATGQEQEIHLGNLDVQRDFGFAPDYVDAMIKMALLPSGDDYVLASGTSTSVRDFVEFAFSAINIELDWHGEGLQQVGVERGSNTVRVRVDAKFFRPLDARVLVGDATKARTKLGFRPTADTRTIARNMVTADLARVRAACA